MLTSNPAPKPGIWFKTCIVLYESFLKNKYCINFILDCWTIVSVSCFNLLTANPTKWSNTLKTIRRLLLTNCLSVFDHFVWLSLIWLTFCRPMQRKTFFIKIAIQPIFSHWYEMDSPANIYLFRVKNWNARKRFKICSKLSIKIRTRRSAVFIVNFEHISYLF